MIKEVNSSDKVQFNRLSTHPLQAWEWGEFRLKTGIEVKRLGRYVKGKLSETAQITIHPIPFTSYKIGYFPKGGIPSSEILESLKDLGEKEKMIFVKIEPNVLKKDFPAKTLSSKFPFAPSPHPLFTRYTFRLNLQPTAEELMGKLHRKTRYNIRLSERKGVKIIEDNSDKSFKQYLKLLEETTKRQHFYAHTPSYHRLMWETLRPAGIARLLLAKYREQVLVAWVLFLFNDVLYYPYGASSTSHRNLMPSNLMMWQAVLYGKKNGAKVFDMWGALGPTPSPKDPWYGFHRFKEGYGAKLVELAGSFDLVINPAAYRVYNLVHKLRQMYLKVKSL